MRNWMLIGLFTPLSRLVGQQQQRRRRPPSIRVSFDLISTLKQKVVAGAEATVVPNALLKAENIRAKPKDWKGKPQ